MKLIAPGKLVLTGAYAVLDGAPAVVVAVDRYASAELDRPDEVDVTALHDAGGVKLGLGSSAASAVVTEAARRAARGDDVTTSTVREEIFARARAAHAASQGGGSGVDVAAAVHGGALVYGLRGSAASIAPAPMPRGLALEALFSGASARTSDLRARVEAARRRSPGHRAFGQLAEVASDAAARFAAGDAEAFVALAGAFGLALGALGDVADAPIVPRAFAELAAEAARAGGAFLPSGAGGGDVGVWLGLAPPPAAFVALAGSRAMRPLHLGVDHGGVRPFSPAS